MEFCAAIRCHTKIRVVTGDPTWMDQEIACKSCWNKNENDNYFSWVIKVMLSIGAQLEDIQLSFDALLRVITWNYIFRNCFENISK